MRSTFTPRPLGPFLDIAEEIGGELADLLESGAKSYQVAASVIREAQARRGMIIVLEDPHWADEATLDVVSMLGRRIESVPALVVATYRDDELDRGHPLRGPLGELRGAGSIRRLPVEPLSLAAVASLAQPHGLDASALHRATGGNPFFVSEVLAARGADIPPTVRDAVLARTARLDSAAHTVIEAVSIALPQAELWLLDALAADAAQALQRCLSSGILEVAAGGVSFRHDLARRAVEESLAPHRREALHISALRALSAPPNGGRDFARLAHHAEAAGDTGAVLEFAPAAARYASSIGAHRESAGQYQRALRFGAALPPGATAELLEGLSYECYITDQLDASVDTLERAIEFRRACDDRLAEGAALSTLSRRMWCAARTTDARRAARSALRLLESLPAGAELALAYSNLGQLHMNDEHLAETVAWTNRALAIAERIGDTAVIVHSLNNIGTMQVVAGLPEGRRNVERSLDLAEEAGLEEHIGRAYINVGWAMTRTRAYDLAPWFDRGVKRCEDLGLEVWKLYVLAYRARFHLDAGRWDEAADDATVVLKSSESAPLLRILALTIIGLVRARRGDPEQWPPLDEALALLDGQHELQYLAPVATARAEAAWLEGRHQAVDEASRDTLAVAVSKQAAWVVGELAWLRRLAGMREAVVEVVEPYSAQLAGDVETAARWWTKLGCPYDAALAVVESDDEAGLRKALAEFQRLGARPAAGIVARRLRELGVRGLPRGPRLETQANPKSLTRRETEVLALVRQGLSNAEIATRLYLSENTVHHHISAILRKLGVSSRLQAASEAARLGLTAVAS